jgi:homoserine dehydrogenase
MKSVRIGIIGFGKVIRAFLELLPEKADWLKNRFQQDLKIVAICDSTEYMHNPDGFDPGELLAYKLEKMASDRQGRPLDPSEVGYVVGSYLEMGVNVVVEALPPSRETGEPALNYLLSFLNEKVPVVTVNKSPLVYGYQSLYTTARKQRTALKFSGATGSALPTVDTISTALAGADLYGFEAILNGTTNFLLTEMIKNRSDLATELEIAQELSICEPDPLLDINGWDTAFKTLILAKAFIDPYVELPDVQIQGIQGLTYADVAPVVQAGNTLKLLGKAGFENDRLRLRVKPSIITPEHPFFRVEGTTKAVTFFTDTMGRLTLIGGASGLKETAATILKDVLNTHRDMNLF